MSDTDRSDDRTEPDGKPPVPSTMSTASLRPKGTCWYCNQPVDNVRRFCSKSCADDYRIDEAFTHPPA